MNEYWVLYSTNESSSEVQRATISLLSQTLRIKVGVYEKENERRCRLIVHMAD